MGFLMENGKSEYSRDRNNNRWIREKIENGLQLTASFRDGLRFKKAKIPFNCWECEKTKPKNTRYLCKEYHKVCSDCAIKWVDCSIETLKEAIELLEKSKAELSANGEKWRREMILGAVS